MAQVVGPRGVWPDNQPNTLYIIRWEHNLVMLHEKKREKTTT